MGIGAERVGVGGGRKVGKGLGVAGFVGAIAAGGQLTLHRVLMDRTPTGYKTCCGPCPAESYSAARQASLSLQCNPSHPPHPIPGSGKAEDKIAALQKAGVHVSMSPAQLGTTMVKAYKEHYG